MPHEQRTEGWDVLFPNIDVAGAPSGNPGAEAGTAQTPASVLLASREAVSLAQTWPISLRLLGFFMVGRFSPDPHFDHQNVNSHTLGFNPSGAQDLAPFYLPAHTWPGNGYRALPRQMWC